ncbi:N-acetylglucosamine-6-phosphate deacetylase [Flavihumibacter profundi]|uniref:N-acetylglucosamine-6-phosphate deacetylase n=1 Tax=Flavihumibacter profundi TaxID=2716883 RepID=UPI001CC5094F|nr:N-acetylglucosamine-6-phosphate deacetylase [Flavihumibacter profundi]MBZ5859053.1 N-acetylglucosamine-6-phosphate deacetylase [Flavihumibacter profundi]
MSKHSIKYFNGRIFNGESWMDQAVISIENDRITSVANDGSTDEQIDLQGKKLVPAFIDIQLYGGNGQFFGEHPTVAALEATVAYSREGGASLILPTVATNTNDVSFAAIDAVREYWKAGGKGVAGLHLEGPFLNAAKRGAHAIDKIQEPTVSNIRKLVDYGKGVVRMMTIALELFSEEAMKILQEAGIIISAGHSNATYTEANSAFDKGIKVCTHLFNAMSPLQHRAPGLVGAILDHPTVMSSIVTDGYHVDAAVIRLAKKLMGERLFIITDAVTENNEGYYQHRLAGNRYVMPDGTLSGSALTMAKAVKYCVEQVGIDEGEALRMASLYPARVLGLEKEWGKIAPGYMARFYMMH